jgi:hypothetical protein
MEAKRIEGDLWDCGTVHAEGGSNRLCLRYVGEEGLDFHELVWERQINGRWARHRTLDPRSFLCARNGSPWVAELHSFDAEFGTAIVKVGENGPENEKGVSHVGYSWRRVSFVEPMPPKLLQICKNPFEPYDG